MSLPDSLQSAFKSLTGALDLLEAAIERRVQAQSARADLEQEFAIMQEDRAQLGEDLELAVQENDRLRAVTAEVAGRVARMEDLCAALQRRVAE